VANFNKEIAKIRASVGTNFSGMFVCLGCTWIYGPWSNDSNTYVQRCECRRKEFKDEPRWERFDFNEVVELCRCCGQDLLQSGSRWSVWFCVPCQTRVSELNSDCQRTVIPIGRHSLMHGIGISGSEIKDRSQIESKVAKVFPALQGLFASQDHLSLWREKVVSANLKLLNPDSDVPLETYLLEMARLVKAGTLDKSKSFDELCKFFSETHNN
jgi:hypothetical protein